MSLLFAVAFSRNLKKPTNPLIWTFFRHFHQNEMLRSHQNILCLFTTATYTKRPYKCVDNVLQFQIPQDHIDIGHLKLPKPATGVSQAGSQL